MIEIQNIFKNNILIKNNFLIINDSKRLKSSTQTNDVFSEKWKKVEEINEKEKSYEFQKEWYLKLYGFDNESSLANFLSKKKYIFDAGCGLGYKAKWFADLSPNSIVIGMDFTDSCKIAAENYKDKKNLFFLKGDISDTPFKNEMIDYVSCDQVIMHTEIPEDTFTELSRIMCRGGEFACYVYAKKALPRELLDEHFRSYCKNLSNDELWDMSEKLTDLGKTLSGLNIEINVPDIPQMDIKGGKYDIQRFIYWNFLKCFWNEELGYDISVATNFDWYSPSNAKRYSEQEYKEIIDVNNLKIKFFHSEEACYSGRFKK